MKYHRFDPYAADEQRAFHEKCKEQRELIAGRNRLRPEAGTEQSALRSWKAAQTRKKKVQISLAPVKFGTDKK